VTVSSRREAVAYLQARRGRSERAASRTVGVARSTQRYASEAASCKHELRDAVIELARKHPRYCYRRVTALLRRSGRAVNAKAVWRVWSEESLAVPKRGRRRRRRRVESARVQQPRGARANEVWSVDFVHDRTEDGRPVRILSLIDEATRECLALDARRRQPARLVAETLEAVAAERGAPSALRSDNGPEFVSDVLAAWRADRGVERLLTKPGNPWQNGCVESFHDKLRDECLSREWLPSLSEMRVVLDDYRREYNTERPHSSLGNQTPAEARARLRGADSAPLRQPLAAAGANPT